VTAYKELTDLVRLDCLVPLGKGGRSSACVIPWNEFCDSEALIARDKSVASARSARHHSNLSDRERSGVAQQ
jgi:hypothetical protein